MRSIFFVLFGLFLSGVSSITWHYGGNESHWPGTCKTGKKQSPIPLNYTAVQKSFGNIVFDNYNLTYRALVINNDHTIEVKPENSKSKIKSGGLTGEYTLDHLHFHWKSEHTIGNRRYPLEVHLVHYATVYKNFETALKYKDGVAVLATMFDLSPDDDAQFGPLIEAVAVVKQKFDTGISVNGLQLTTFLPRDVAGYYRYEGSLTTPNCTEAVTWTIFTNTIHISKKQVREFESMRSDKGVPTQNYRSMQPSHGRKIYRKVSPLLYGAATSNFRKSVLVLIFLMAFTRTV